MNGSSSRHRFEHPPITTLDDRLKAGRQARQTLPRTAHSEYTADAGRDPLDILRQQNEGRLPWLVPLRLERMMQNPFAFYRGTAALQAADLAGAPTTGAGVVLCGDAHISNFGLFASPQRTMVFDLNDFDEAAFGPWEWDVKRFVTSVVIAGRHKGFSSREVREAAHAAAAAYRLGLNEMLELDTLERYYRRAEVNLGSSRYGKDTQLVIDQALTASARRTSARELNRITELGDDGTISIVERPPTLTHVPPDYEFQVKEMIETYRHSVSPDIAFLLSQYTVTDIVRRVVGVGSVGTRCFIAVLTGPSGEGLILQIKEAGRSVLNEYGGIEPVVSHLNEPEALTADHGLRVVANQRILQAVSDPFLGYFTGIGLGFYVRQFRDRNISIDIEALKRNTFLDYVDACGRLLARAHSQSPNAAFAAGYIGNSDAFTTAVTEWAHAYADQSHADFVQLGEAIRAGTFPMPDMSPELALARAQEKARAQGLFRGTARQ